MRVVEALVEAVVEETGPLRGTLRLTLHRAPTDPDATADQGYHGFTYSLLPHAGTWRTGVVNREAYALNDPMFASLLPANPHGSLPQAFAWASVDVDHVILETVKKAEDEEAWIVRVYECKQSRNSAVSLDFGQPIRKAVACNLIEDEESPAGFRDHRLTFAIRPYEIKTFKLSF